MNIFYDYVIIDLEKLNNVLKNLESSYTLLWGLEICFLKDMIKWEEPAGYIKSERKGKVLKNFLAIFF